MDVDSSDAVVLKDVNKPANNDGAAKAEPTINAISMHSISQLEHAAPDAAVIKQQSVSEVGVSLHSEPHLAETSKLFQYGSVEADGSKQQLNVDSASRCAAAVKWAGLSASARQSGVTVADIGSESLDFDDDFSQIPFGSKKTF